MKVLISTFSFPPELNGVAEASSFCAKVFLDQGCQVDIATTPTMPSRESLNWMGAEIREFKIAGTSYFRQPFHGAIADYQSFLREGRWDAVFFQGYSWPLLLAAPLLEHISAKKILVSHGYGALIWFPMSRFPFGLGFWAYSAWKSLRMLRWVKNVDRWVFLSHRRDFGSFYDHLLARLVRHPGITVIPNGVDPAQRGSAAAFRKELHLRPNQLVFLYVGYFSRGKNQIDAVRAFREAKIPNSCLVLIGSEPNTWMEEFKKADLKTASSNDENPVFWLAGKSRRFTLDAFAGCDIYISSSILETQPITILEAMREAKPWVAYPAGCIQEFPGGICVKNKDEMAHAMLTLANSPEKRANLGRLGKHSVQTVFSKDQYARAYLRLLKNVVV